VISELAAAAPCAGGAGSAAPDVVRLVSDLAGARVDEGDREVALVRLIDTAFATAVGCRTEQGRRSAAVSAALHGVDSLAGRASRLAAACRMTEIDDIDLLSCTTAGAVVVPTVFALLTSCGSPPPGRAEILDAVVLGYEVAVGLGESMDGPARLAAGVWPTLAAAPVTAAVVATLLVGERDDLERAVALAAQQSIHGNPRGTAREHMFAGAVLTGIASALAVRQGYTTAGSSGDDLGGLLTRGVPTSGSRRIHRPAVKGFCSARQAMTAVAALQEAVRGHRVEPASIGRIDVHVPRQYASMLDKPRVQSRRDSVSSAQYQLALAICRPEGLLNVDRTALRADELAAVMATVQVHRDDELSAQYPERWPARVRVVASGATFEATAEEVPGEDDHSLVALTRKIERFSPETSALGAQITAAATDERAGLAALARLLTDAR